MLLRYVWDVRKAKGNHRKHGITFGEAKTVFLDPLAGTRDDPDHSENEDRFITIGATVGGHLLVVVHIDDDASTVRIISARLATARERQEYEES